MFVWPFCLLVCLFWGFLPLENVSLIRRHQHYRWRAANINLCSARMVIEQVGFFSVSHQLWDGASNYNGPPQEPLTLTSVAESLAVELSLPILMIKFCRGRDSNTQPSAFEANANRLRTCLTFSNARCNRNQVHYYFFFTNSGLT